MKTKDSQEPTEQTVNLKVSNRTVFRVVLIVVAALLTLAAIRQAAYPLTLIFIAFFLALALNSPVHWLERHLPGKRLKTRPWALAISFVAVILALAGFFAAIVPPLVREAGEFIEGVPGLIEQTRDENSAIGQLIARYELGDDIENAANQFSNQLGNVGAVAASTVTSVASSIVASLTVLVLTLMMLLEGKRWMHVFRGIVPSRKLPRVEKIVGDMYKVVKGYVNGQLLLAFLAALVLLPALFALGIPYPAALVVLVFLFALIPLIGNTLGAIVVTLVALTQSWVVALIILGYYLLYQQIENYLIQPRIQANSTNMSPLLVFSAVIVGVSFGGMVAALFAIPVAGCIRILVLDYLHHKGYFKEGDVDTGNVKLGASNK
jgi:predicted PurR-regulated permease PerM